MTQTISGDALQLRSIIKSDGTLELSLETLPIPQPKDDEVLVRIEASPINPSDLGLLFGAADPSTMRASGSPDRPVVTASVPEKSMRAMAARVAAEIKTTFASHYTREVSLAEALTLEAIAVYGKQATGEKFLLNPNKGLA
jgi:hypothetical protein